jgi:hypothetical protein
MKRLTDKLSYANVIASIALFISLGGASYAAIALPANSVGPKQLQTGAVATQALSFPLGAVGITNNKPDDQGRGYCNGGKAFSGPGVPPCPAPIMGGTAPGQEVHIHLSQPGQLMLSAIASLKYEGAAGTTATVTLELILNGGSTTTAKVILSGGQTLQAPIQALRKTSAGTHTAGIKLNTQYGAYGNGDIIVTSVSLTAIALPTIATDK